jgi:predicted dehydrogenase
MAEKHGKVTRRGFGQALAAAAAVSAPAAAQIATPGPGQFGPVVVGNYRPIDQIVFGGIGIRGRGMADLRMLLGDNRVKFVGIADVREDAREMVKSTVDGYYGNNECKMYRDPAEILARPDVDALLIATSDRWHGPMAMWAAQSGKDMYIEKPGAMSINESYAMAENVRRYGVVYQSGAQRRNQYSFEFADG